MICITIITVLSQALILRPPQITQVEYSRSSGALEHLLTNEVTFQGNASLMDVQKGHEELQASVLPMVVVRDVRNQGATKGQRAELLIVRPMGEGEGVSAWDAQKVPRGRQITALLTEVVDGVVILGAARLPEAGQVCASGMEGAKGARWKDALAVLRGRLVCVSHMEGGVGVSTQNVQKEPKEAPPIARPMVAANGAFLQGAPKAPKGAHHCARATVEGNDVCLTEVVFVRKVYMAELIFALRMVVVRGVLSQNVQRVPVAALTTALGMVAVSDAGLITVERVLKAVQTSVRHMVEENAVHGDKAHARSLLGGRVASVQHMVAWSKTKTTTRAI